MMYISVFSYIFPTWSLHYKHVFVPKTMEFDQSIIPKSLFCSTITSCLWQ